MFLAQHLYWSWNSIHIDQLEIEVWSYAKFRLSTMLLDQCYYNFPLIVGLGWVLGLFLWTGMMFQDQQKYVDTGTCTCQNHCAQSFAQTATKVSSCTSQNHKKTLHKFELGHLNFWDTLPTKHMSAIANMS